MTFTIGHLDLVDFEQWDEAGASVSVSGDLYTAGQSVAWHKRVRESLGHLIGTVQPVTSSEDSSIDGFYRVRSGSCASVPATLASGFMLYDLSLEALPHKRTAALEISSKGDDRTGAPVTPQPWLAVPGGALAWDDAGANPRPLVHPTDPGGTALEVQFATSTSSPDFYAHFSKWLSAPSARLSCAPRVLFGGQVIHGMQDTDDFSEVVVDNGGLRISKGTTALFSVESVDLSGSSPYDWSSAWEVGPGFYDTIGAGWLSMDPDGVVGVQVLEESAERVIVRYVIAINDAPATVDLWLRRGSWYAELVINTPWLDASQRLGMYLEDTAATALTGNYAIRTGTLADGTRHFAGLGVDSTELYGSDAIYTDDHATKVRACFGFGNPSGSDNDTPGDIHKQAWAGQSIRETISQVRL